MKNIFNFITGTLLTTVVYFLGGLDVALKTLLIFILLDYVTGVCEAISNKKLNSIIGAKGIIKKIGYLIIVALAVQLDTVTGDTGAIRTLVIYFFVANEGISILENWGSMGLPLPQKIIDTLEQLKKEYTKYALINNNIYRNIFGMNPLVINDNDTNNSFNIKYDLLSYPALAKQVYEQSYEALEITRIYNASYDTILKLSQQKINSNNIQHKNKHKSPHKNCF